MVSIRDLTLLSIQRTVTLLRFPPVQTLATKPEVRHTFARAQRWCLRAIRGMLAVTIRSGLCGDQDVATHPRMLKCAG